MVESKASGLPVDLTNCDREPIRFTGSIQPHGVLFVLDKDDLRVLQVSQNVDVVFGCDSKTLLEKPLSSILGAERVAFLEPALRAAPIRSRPALLTTLSDVGTDKRVFHAIAHETDGGIVLELESADGDFRSAGTPSDIHSWTDSFTLHAEGVQTAEELANLVCREIRRLTGFDRVLVYRFDIDWNGLVVGEDGSGRLPTYFQHRFPATDIPAQARELYRTNRIRLIPDAYYDPVPLVPATNPATREPVDLSFSTLRSVSPVHVEYMRNMETASSMSVSILKNGRLWGLISCHHHEPKGVSYPDRITCDILSRAFSLRLSSIEHAKEYERRIDVQSTFSRLLSVMSEGGDYVESLCGHSTDLLRLVDASGAALVTERSCIPVGETPTIEQIRSIADWVADKCVVGVYATESLPNEFLGGQDFVDRACGLLAIRISRLHPSFVLWFRPEVIQTIKWGGNPAKSVSSKEGQMSLHPRRSFETWRETVRFKAAPWDESAIDGATQLQNAIVGTVLRRAEELADLNAELTRSNKELEAFSYSVSHDLRAPLRHIVGYAEMLRETASERLDAKEDQWLANIMESSEYAGDLVDKLLGYSRLGRSDLQLSRISLNTLVREVRANVEKDASDRSIEWIVSDLPTVNADLMMMRMAIRDLLANAVKYTRNEEQARIEIGCRADVSEDIVFVKDNGVGFDMAYVDKLFGVFQRLHRWEDYEGTGIGLANVRRVMERHGGRTWAEGAEGQGATFYFSLPKSRGDTTNSTS